MKEAGGERVQRKKVEAAVEARERQKRKRDRDAPAGATDLAEACLKMRIDVTCTLPSTDEKMAMECKSVAWCKSYMQRSGCRRGGKYGWRFGTTADYIAAKAKQDRLEHVALIDSQALGGQGALATALAKQGQLEGCVVGGCCELSTSVHHLVDRLGIELGYRMSEDTGYDVEDCITCATKGLKLRVARRVWRDYYRHSFARRHNADPSTEGLADQQREWKIREDDWRREAQERARQHEFWATKARNLSAWAPRGMG